MANRMKSLHLIARDNRGQDLVEYALFAAFFAVIAAVAIPGGVTAVENCWSGMVSVLNMLTGGVSGS